jgi:hypothetical protein
VTDLQQQNALYYDCQLYITMQVTDLATANEFAESDVLTARAAAGLTDTAVSNEHCNHRWCSFV